MSFFIDFFVTYYFIHKTFYAFPFIIKVFLHLKILYSLPRGFWVVVVVVVVVLVVVVVELNVVGKVFSADNAKSLISI